MLLSWWDLFQWCHWFPPDHCLSIHLSICLSVCISQVQRCSLDQLATFSPLFLSFSLLLFLLACNLPLCLSSEAVRWDGCGSWFGLPNHLWGCEGHPGLEEVCLPWHQHQMCPSMSDLTHFLAILAKFNSVFHSPIESSFWGLLSPWYAHKERDHGGTRSCSFGPKQRKKNRLNLSNKKRLFSFTPFCYDVHSWIRPTSSGSISVPVQWASHQSQGICLSGWEIYIEGLEESHSRERHYDQVSCFEGMQTWIFTKNLQREPYGSPCKNWVEFSKFTLSSHCQSAKWIINHFAVLKCATRWHCNIK